MKALEKDRARRYETANGLAMDVERHLDSQPVVARPASAAYRFQRWARRHRLLFAAIAAVAVTLVLGIVASTGKPCARGEPNNSSRSCGPQAETARQQAEANARRAEAAAMN